MDPIFVCTFLLTMQDIEDAEYLLQLEPPVEYICAAWLMTASACWIKMVFVQPFEMIKIT